MKSYCRGLLSTRLAVMLVASMLSVGAAEWKSDTHGFSVKLPGDWNQIASQNTEEVLVARNREKTRRLIVKVVSADGETELTPILAGIKRGFERRGGKIENERCFDLQGVSACEFMTTSEHDGTQMKSLVRLCLDGSKVYLLYYIWRAEQLAQDEARSFMDSFRLLSRPTTNSSTRRTSAALLPEDQSDRASVVIGQIVGFVLMGGVVIGVVSIASKIRRRRTPSVIQPPSLS